VPSSARKDVVQVIGIQKVPSHLSKEEFETKYETLIDELLALPQFKENLLKVELVRIEPLRTFREPNASPLLPVFTNHRFDQYLASFGIPPREPIVAARAVAKVNLYV
jgi:hypothetical protein